MKEEEEEAKERKRVIDEIAAKIRAQGPAACVHGKRRKKEEEEEEGAAKASLPSSSTSFLCPWYSTFLALQVASLRHVEI